MLTAHDADEEFDGDFHATATELAAPFAHPMPQLVAATSSGDVQRWVIRDRKPLEQWSKGRVTIIGDAAHPTSPYAAYGAGMATEDGYYLGRKLAGLDLTDHGVVSRALLEFEAPRRPHTAFQSQTAYRSGPDVPPRTESRWRRCETPSSTTRRSSRRSSARRPPAKSSSSSTRSTRPRPASPGSPTRARPTAPLPDRGRMALGPKLSPSVSPG